MTAEMARARLILAGYQGEPTPEVLRQWGWTPIDPLAGFDPATPARTPQQLQDDFALLVEEAKANAVPAKILDAIAKFGAFAFKLI
jgi:hypothetical protein